MRRKYRQLIRLHLAHGRSRALARSALRSARVALALALGDPRPRPLLGTIIPTYRCDSACAKCAKRALAQPGAELGTEDFLRAIDDFVRLKVVAIDFSGGEPLLRPDIFELLRHASSRGLLTHLNTNARLLDEKKAAELLTSGLSSINVSVDTLSVAKSSRLTGRREGLRDILSGLRHLLDARARLGSEVLVTLVTVLQEENTGELGEILAFGRDVGADAVTFNPLHCFPVPLGQPAGAATTEATVASLIALKKANPLLENSVSYIRLLNGFRKRLPLPIPCVAGRTNVVLDAHGRVFPCFVWLEREKSGVPLDGRSLAATIASREYRDLAAEAAACRACYWNCHAELSLFFRRFAAVGAAIGR